MIDQESYFSPEKLKITFESRITKSRAVGLDGTRLALFRDILDQEVDLISRKVLGSGYAFTCYKEKLISKGARRLPRQLSVPTVRDRLTLRSACDCLGALVPKSSAIPPHSHIRQIAQIVRGSSEPLSFLRMDVKEFFPSIVHEKLLARLDGYSADPFLRALIKSAIENPTGTRAGSRANMLGVPQGLSISNVLSSIYMLEFDKVQSSRGHYHRYVDDILLVAPTRDIKARYVELWTELTQLGLTPHPLGSAGKTEERRISDGVDYLGYRISRDKISVRPSSYKRMFSNLLNVITSFRYTKNKEKVLFKLNLRITGCIVDGRKRGWLMFFSQTEDKAQLRYLDEFVVKQLGRVALPSTSLERRSFVRAYHEIRYKGAASNYIPDFDTFTRDSKVQTIAVLTGAAEAELNTRSVEAIDIQFERLIAKEVADLEQDVLSALS